MIYDLGNPLHAEQYKLRVNKLYESKAIVELIEKKPKRTISQNKYLHVIIAYFAVETGYTAEWVKREYFKKHCNAELFIKTAHDDILGKDIKYLLSSTELDTEQMTTAIERFRNWSAQEVGVYLPAPNEHDMLMIAESEIERSKKYL